MAVNFQVIAEAAETSVFAERSLINEFLAISGKSTLTQQRKPWANMSGRARHVYVTKERDAVVAALEVIIPDEVGGLWEALKESGEVESALGLLSDPHPADDKYLKSLAEAYQIAVGHATTSSLRHGRPCAIQSYPAL